MKTTTMLMMSALSAFVAGAGGGNGAKPVSFEYSVSPAGATNAAFTAAEPGAWDSLPAALKTAREKCKKDKTPIAGETVVFAKGEYKGLSLALSGAGENIPFI